MKLLTAELRQQLPPLYAQEHASLKFPQTLAHN